MEKIKSLIKNNFTFIKYMFSAGFSFLIDVSLFSIFIFLFKGHIGAFELIATISARIISSVFNYLLNKNKVFSSNKKGKIDRETFIKYAVLVVIQTFVSGITVTLICKNVNLPEHILKIPGETFVKVPVEIILFINNYFIQKYFIFTDNPKRINVPENLKTILFSIAGTFTLITELNRSGIVKSSLTKSSLLMAFLTIFLGVFYKKYHDKFEKSKAFNILSFILSIFMVVGYSYYKVGSAYLVFGNIGFIIISIIKFISYFTLINIALKFVYNLLTEYKINDKVKNNKLVDLFNKHPFLFCCIAMLICYVPYIVAYYPAVMGYDPSNQIREFMGMHTRYMDSVILLDPNVTITNFNPVLHTLLLGGCFKLGHIMGNDNLGLFIYVVIQTIIVITTLSYSIVYMKRQGVGNKLLFIVLGIYCFVPVFPFYTLSTNKDMIFCCFVLLYCLKLYDLIKNKQDVKNYISLFVIMLLVTLTRNNGVYTIVLSLPFTFIWLKDKRKPVLVTLIAVLACYGCYNKVILPAFKISNTSIREMLSVPFQQTARLAKYHPEAFSEKDKEIIDKILIFDTLGERYNPELSDPVKNKYNIYTTNDDLMKYFGVWTKGLTKYPDVYMDSTINNIYGYFYPNTSSWYLYYTYNTKLKEAGFDYHYNSLSGMRDVLSGYGLAYPRIPLIGLFVNIGFVGWVYFFLFTALIRKKLYKYIPFVLPALSFILVCVAGPANTYFRYALPYIMPLPMTVCLLYYEFQTKQSNKRKKLAK